MADRRRVGYNGPAGVARDVLSTLVRSLPDYIIKASGAFLRWYFRLSLLGMLLVAAVIAVIIMVASPAVGLPLGLQHSITHALGPVLALVLLIVIIFAVIRPGRR